TAPAPTPTLAAAPTAAAVAKPTPPSAAAQPTVAAAAAKPAQPTQAPPKALGKIIISQPSASLGFSPVLLADKMGLFKEQGLDAEVIYAGSGSKATAAVIGRSADVGATSLGDIIGAMDQGQDIKIFVGLVTRPTGAIVLNKAVAA